MSWYLFTLLIVLGASPEPNPSGYVMWATPYITEEACKVDGAERVKQLQQGSRLIPLESGRSSKHVFACVQI